MSEAEYAVIDLLANRIREDEYRIRDLWHELERARSRADLLVIQVQLLEAAAGSMSKVQQIRRLCETRAIANYQMKEALALAGLTLAQEAALMRELNGNGGSPQ